MKKIILLLCITGFVTLNSCEKEEINPGGSEVLNETTEKVKIRNSKVEWTVVLVDQQPTKNNREFIDYKEQHTCLHYIGCMDSPGTCLATVGVSISSSTDILLSSLVEDIQAENSQDVIDNMTANNDDYSSLFGSSNVSGVINESLVVEYSAGDEEYYFILFKNASTNDPVAEFPIKLEE